MTMHAAGTYCWRARVGWYVRSIDRPHVWSEITRASRHWRPTWRGADRLACRLENRRAGF